MNRVLLLMVFLCFAMVSFGQSIIRQADSTNILTGKAVQAITPKLKYEVDSLSQVLRITKKDTEKVAILNELSRIYWIHGNSDTAISYAHRALSLAEKINLPEEIANAYNNTGAAFMENADYTEALKNYLIALTIRKRIDDKPGIMHSYVNIGNVYINQANYPEALKNYLAGLKIAEETNDNGNRANAHEGVGNVYAQEGNYAEALKNYLVSLKIRQDSKDQHGMLLSHVNIGDIYAKQSNYTEALKNYFVVLEQGKKLKDFRVILYTYGGIGNVYTHQGKYAEALKNYRVALKMQEQVEDKYGIADSYINMGKTYFNMHNYVPARNNLQKGLFLAKESRSMDEIREAYNTLSKTDSATGNFKNAYQYNLLYSGVKDSILNEKSSEQINRLKIQYETDKKDQQIKTQMFQISSQNLQLQNKTLQGKIFQTRVYYGIAISLMAIGVTMLLFYLRNRRRKKEYENKLVSLELIVLKSQLNPHFISNALISIKSYIDANPQTGTDYLSRFSLLIRGVLDCSEEKEISLDKEMQLMQHYIELEKLRLSNNLDYSITFDNLVNKWEIMIPPLITQPIIENAIWHGLTPDDKNRELTIHHSLHQDMLIITVNSNAIKDDTDSISFPKRKSHGIRITRERLALLKKINGKEGALRIEILPDKTVVDITIPLVWIVANNN